jgi:hypothetical protein
VNSISLWLRTSRARWLSAVTDIITERTEEMRNLRVKIDSTMAHDSYAAWREGQHDVLSLSESLADWWEKVPRNDHA